MRVVLIPLALLLAMFAWFAWSWESPRPDGPAAAPAPVAAVPVVPVQAEAPVAREPERVVPEWRPDGRIWLRVRDGGADGELLRSGNFAWADVDARQAPGREVVADEDGWWRVESSPGAALLLSARGFVTAALVDATPEQRREVVLARAVRVPLDVVDCDTGAVAPEVVVEVSRQSWDEVADAPIVVPGADPATAIYRALASDEGGAELFVPAVAAAAEWQLAVAHRHYMLAHRQPETLSLLPFEHVRVEVQMPLVGAIRYVGGELLRGAVSTGAAPASPSVKRREREQLAMLRQRLIGEDASTVAFAFLPERVAIDVAALAVTADVVLRRGGARKDRMLIQRLCDYDGPQEIGGAAGPELRVSTVRVLPPSSGRGGFEPTHAGVFVRKRGASIAQRVAFGEEVELEAGTYLLRPGLDSGMLGTQVEVVGSGQEDFELQWDESRYLHRVVIEADTQAPHVALRYERDGRSYFVRGPRDEHGVAWFWATQRIERGDVLVPHQRPCEAVTFTFDAAGVGHAACTTERL